MIAYIAAPFKRKREALEVARELEGMGIESNARWLTAHPDSDDPVELGRQAEDDLRDVAAADIFILLNYKGWLMEGQGGKHVETGYALAMGKPVYLVGKRWNVFHYLPHINVVQGPGELAALALGQRTGDETV